MRLKKGRIIFAIVVIITAIMIGLMHADAANEKTIAFEDENLYIQVKDSLGDKVRSFDNEKKTITEPFIKERCTKKFKTFNNYKSNKGVQTKITWKKDSSNKLFSNNRLKRHLTLDLRSKTDRKYFNAKRHLYKYKSFKK